MGKWKRNWHITTYAVLLLSVGIYFLGKQIPQDQLEAFVKQSGPWAPFVFILLYQLNIIFAPINGLPLLISGFYLFGANAVVLIFLGSIVGNSINFVISKKWGRSIVSKLTSEGTIVKIDRLSAEFGLGTLFLLRLFLIGLGDYISYAYGLTKIKYLTFISISAVAMFPTHIIWFYFARKTENIEAFLTVAYSVTFVAIGLLIALAFIFKKHKKIMAGLFGKN